MIVKVVELWCNKPGCKASFQSRCLTGVGARAEAVKVGWTHVLTRVTRSGPAMSEDFCPDHPKEPSMPTDQLLRLPKKDSCSCPSPMTCPYCSRMYPCDCAGCPSKQAAKPRQLNIDPMSITVSFVDEEHLLDKSCRVLCKTCKARPRVEPMGGMVWDECGVCYSKGYGK